MRLLSKRIFGILLALMMLFSVGFAFVQKPNAFADEINIKVQNNYNAAFSKVEINNSITKWQIETKKTDAKSKNKDILKKVLSSVNTLTDVLPGIVKGIQKVNNSNDLADMLNARMALGDTIVSTVGSLLPLLDLAVPGVGSICSCVLNVGQQVFKLIMGGESATGEIQQMEDRLNQQFDEINDKLANIEEQINDISNQINESTDKIISAMTTALDNADAKRELRAFILSSGKDDFSYNKYRNYIYGATTNNANARTAYNAKLKEALANGASDSVIKNYYDKLYEELTENQDVFQAYILGSNDEDSIINIYYKTVLANRNLLKETGDSPEIAAIKFAYELYQTYMEADMIMLGCNIYQYREMLLNGSDSYSYTESDLIEKSYIENKGNLDAIIIGEKEIYNKIASELAKICGMTDSYILENEGLLYEISDNGDSSFGNITSAQSVYLNGMPDSVCELFGFDTNDFVYYVNGGQIDGIIKHYPDGHYCATLKYIYDEETSVNIGSLNFTVSDSVATSLGSGTVENPFLIENKEQFLNIKNDLNKHYKLINDIDFNSEEVSPIGYYLNSNYNESYKDFNGSLDGNGFKIKNIVISGESYSGLFAKIGSKGVVKNLTLENVKVSAEIKKAKSSVNNYYAGIVCGFNQGTISNCKVYSNNGSFYGVFFDLNNEVHNRTIIAYVGGIAGANNYSISSCKVSNITVKGASVHDFGGDEPATNQNSVLVGGLTGKNNGYLGYSAVTSGVRIKSYAKSIYNPAKNVASYINSLAGGICAQDNNEYKFIENVYSGVNYNDIAADFEHICQSNYADLGYNWKIEKSVYVPEMSLEMQNAVVAPYAQIESLFSEIGVEFTLEYKNNGNYCRFDNATSCFNTDGIVLKANGQKIDEKNIAVIRVYGFNGFNYSFEETPTYNTIVLFLITLENGQQVLVKQIVQYVICANEIETFEIIGAKTTFYKGDLTNDAILGAAAKLTYTVGEDIKPITADNIDEFSVNGLDISTYMDFTKSDEEKETRTYTVIYNGVQSNNIEYIVLCEHNRSQVESLYQVGDPVPATCVSRGYTVYHCDICGFDVYKNYTPIDSYAHEVDYEDSEEATCYDVGHIGRIYCKLCNYSFEDGYTIPKKSHEFTACDDGVYHECIECNHSEAHQYTIAESVEYRNVNGVWQYVLVYNYVCQGCGYSKEVVDLNVNHAANNELPKVVITQGYALHGGDEVVVYVQLINNPGVYGAHFGIRYDSRLEWVGFVDGPVLDGSAVSESRPVNCGYNFVWGNGTIKQDDGNLLKIIFKTPYEFNENEIFKIWLVYDLSNNASDPFNGELSIDKGDFDDNLNKNFKNSGFATATGTQLFIAESGSITFVSHLPGDINDDGIVDMLDAVILGKDLVKNEEDRAIGKEIGDLDLNNSVGIDDLVALLIHLTGGYDKERAYPVLNSTFELVLNLNGAELSDLIGIEELNDLMVSVYGDENGRSTYADFGLEVLARNGYKFLGWYDKPVGGNPVDITGDNPDKVIYNKNQKVQTLYAHWEINHITFDGNGATSGQMSDVYYNPNGNETIVNLFEQKYSVLMRDTDSGNNNSAVEGRLIYEILKWQDKNGNEYLLNEIDLSLPDLGGLELFAVWDDGEFSYDLSEWNIIGYNISKWLNIKDKDLWNLSQYTIDITDNESIKNLVKDSTQDTYIYADVTPITYTIRFNGNGNTNIASLNEETNHYLGNDVRLNSNVYEKIGYAFAKWKCVVNDRIYYFDDCAAIGYIDGVNQGDIVVFSAQWVAVNYTAILDYGDGSQSAKQNCSVENPFILEYPQRTGYIFAGWKDNLGYSYVGGEGIGYINGITQGDTIIFTAQWEIEQYYFKFNMNESAAISGRVSGSANTILVNYNQNIVLPTLSCEHCTFNGWLIGNDTTPVKSWTVIDLGNDGVLVSVTASWTRNFTPITTATELSNIRDNTSATYVLMNDIDLSDGFIPIGEFKSTGVLDGNGYTIFNMSAKGIGWHWFGFIQTNSGTIKNLTFSNCSVLVAPRLEYKSETVYCGLVCGVNKGTINNVKIINCSVVANSTNIAMIFKEKTGKDTKDINQSNNQDLWTRWYKQSKLNNNKDFDDGWYQNSEFEYKIYSGGITGWNDNGIISNCFVTGGTVSSNVYHLSAGAGTKNYSVAGGVCGYNTGALTVVSSSAVVCAYADLGNNGNNYGWVGDVYPTAYVYACGIAGISTTNISYSGNVGKATFRHYAPQYGFLSGAGYNTSSKSHSDNIKTSKSASCVKI